MTIGIVRSVIRKFVCSYSESDRKYELTIKFVDNETTSVTQKLTSPSAYRYSDFSKRTSGASIIQFSIDHPSEFDDLIKSIRKEFGPLIAERVLEKAVKETTRGKK